MNNVRYNFSLIEVLVAITIIAICFTILLSALSVNIHNTAISRSYITACMLAEKKLVELPNEKDIKDGEERGDFGEDYPAFRWKTKIKEKSKYLYLVKLTVSFIRAGAERKLVFKTIQLNQKALDKAKDKGKKDKGKSNQQQQAADQKNV